MFLSNVFLLTETVNNEHVLLAWTIYKHILHEIHLSPVSLFCALLLFLFYRASHWFEAKCGCYVWQLMVGIPVAQNGHGACNAKGMGFDSQRMHEKICKTYSFNAMQVTLEKILCQMHKCKCKAMSTLIGYILKCIFFFTIWAFWRQSSKWIHLRIPFSASLCGLWKQSFWKLWRMFLVFMKDIHMFIPVCACYSLAQFCLR